MNTISKIIYIAYYLAWLLELFLFCLLFTDKYYLTGLYLSTGWGALTLLVSVIVLATLLLRYVFLKDKRAILKKHIWRCCLPFIPAMILLCVYFYPNSLEDKEQTLELSHVVWACDCANWATPQDIKKYSDEGLDKRSIFLEPAPGVMEIPDKLKQHGKVIRVTGRFYTKKSLPQNYHSYENVEKARVFRYTKYEVVKARKKEGKE